MVNKDLIVLDKTKANSNIFDKLKGKEEEEIKGIFSFIHTQIKNLFKKEELKIEDIGDEVFFGKQFDGDMIGFNTEIFPRNFMSFLDEKKENDKKNKTYYAKWFLDSIAGEASYNIFGNGFFSYLYDNNYITDKQIIENLKDEKLFQYIDDIYIIKEKNQYKGESSFINEEGNNMANSYVNEDYIINGIKEGADLTKLIIYFKNKY